MHVYRTTVEDGGGFGLFVVLLPVAQDLCIISLIRYLLIAGTLLTM